MNNDIQVLTHREHVLTRPNMYIGSIDLNESLEYCEDQGKITRKKLSYVQGLLKIVDEIIDNAVDICIKTDFKADKVQVQIDRTSVTVTDNGVGIPVVETEQGWMPVLAWGKGMSGSNFTDENRTQAGMNGIGSFATNCFSKEFIGISDDGKKRLTVKFTNNAESYHLSVGKSTAHGCVVQFIPDFARFKLEGFDDTHIALLSQRVQMLALTYPQITFTFNGTKVNARSFKAFVEKFNRPYETVEDKNYAYAVMPADDEFEQYSYVNGLKITSGTHIDVFVNAISAKLKEKLEKKYKGIKPSDIKSHLFICCVLRHFPNAKFDSQSKSVITNSQAEINAFLSIDYDTFVRKILKNDEITSKITEIYRIREEMKRRDQLKGLEKSRKVKDDKYTPSITKNNYLLICEGYCLSEDTPLYTLNGVKTIKDINVQDELLGSDFKPVRVLAKTASLRRTLRIKTHGGDIVCSEKHRLMVYDTQEKVFKYATAGEIRDNRSMFKLVKSRLNQDSFYLPVTEVKGNIITSNLGKVKYTIERTNDNFIAVRNGKITKLSDVMPGDVLILAKYLN